MYPRTRVSYSSCTWNGVPCGISQLRNRWLMLQELGLGCGGGYWHASVRHMLCRFWYYQPCFQPDLSHLVSVGRIWDGIYCWHGCLNLRCGRVSGPQRTTNWKKQFMIFNRTGDGHYSMAMLSASYLKSKVPPRDLIDTC